MLDEVTKFRLERFICYLDEKDTRVKGLRIKFDDNFIYVSGFIKVLESEYVLNEVLKISEYVSSAYNSVYNNEKILSYLIDNILKKISINIDDIIKEKYYAR